MAVHSSVRFSSENTGSLWVRQRLGCTVYRVSITAYVAQFPARARLLQGSLHLLPLLIYNAVTVVHMRTSV